jgi:hypothetical protein
MFQCLVVEFVQERATKHIPLLARLSEPKQPTDPTIATGYTAGQNYPTLAAHCVA